MSRAAIVRSAKVKDGIWHALDMLDNLSALFQGKYVAIKPNDTWASSNDTTACTQADSVEAVIQYVKKFNPSRIVVSGGAGAAETDEVFALLGIDKVIQSEKVEFFDHNRPPFKSVPLTYGPQREVRINPHILEYETLISLAQHKIHYEATVTLTMKNIAMSFPAADYYGHPRGTQKRPNKFYVDMHGFITGMCRRFPIDLGIIVGHPAMTGRGPIGGLAFESELTIASKDCVAADSIGAKILGIDYVEHVEQAADLGLGESSLENIEVAGLSISEARKVFLEKQATAQPGYRQPSRVWTYTHS
ncbi:MAG: DUF362 domain-containing protein [Dehalococcoidales bacterium]|nr:DUF362 domain-containing protein [Dehalococcoidales bacterium]